MLRKSSIIVGQDAEREVWRKQKTNSSMEATAPRERARPQGKMPLRKVYMGYSSMHDDMYTYSILYLNPHDHTLYIFIRCYWFLIDFLLIFDDFFIDIWLIFDTLRPTSPPRCKWTLVHTVKVRVKVDADMLHALAWSRMKKAHLETASKRNPSARLHRTKTDGQTTTELAYTWPGDGIYYQYVAKWYAWYLVPGIYNHNSMFNILIHDFCTHTAVNHAVQGLLFVPCRSECVEGGSVCCCCLSAFYGWPDDARTRTNAPAVSTCASCAVESQVAVVVFTSQALQYLL